MAHSNPDARIAYARKWRAGNIVKVREYHREYRRTHKNAARKEYDRAWKARRSGTINGRATCMLKEAKARAVKRSLPFDLDIRHLTGILQNCVAAGTVACEVNRPDTASLDQKVAGEGYTLANVTVLPIWLNYAKHDFTLNDTLAAISRWQARTFVFRMLDERRNVWLN